MAKTPSFSIKKNVGRAGHNQLADLQIVAWLLNAAMYNYPKFMQEMEAPLDDVNPDVGLVSDAIRKFQFFAMNWTLNGCDGRVDVNGKTWKALNGNVPILIQIRSATSADNTRTYAAFRQGDYPQTIGFGTGRISGIGCIMCCMTMAATAIGARTRFWTDPKLQPKDLTPIKVNDILKQPGASAFSGSLLILGMAAEALGMSYSGTIKSSANSIGDINNHLSRGFPLVLHVDYRNKTKKKEIDNPNYKSNLAENDKTNPKKIKVDEVDENGKTIWESTYEADHWILVVARSGDKYTALDPAYGATVIMTSDKNRFSPGNKRADGAGNAFGYPILCGEAGFQGRSPGDYTVREYGFLSPGSGV